MTRTTRPRESRTPEGEITALHVVPPDVIQRNRQMMRAAPLTKKSLKYADPTPDLSRSPASISQESMVTGGSQHLLLATESTVPQLATQRERCPPKAHVKLFRASEKIKRRREFMDLRDRHIDTDYFTATKFPRKHCVSSAGTRSSAG
jgi:hypothetical protein